MSTYAYVAKDRELISGHSADTAYSLDFGSQRLDRSRVTERHTQKALNGNEHTVGHRIEQVWDVTTAFLGDDANGDAAKMREFLTSVAYGETFVFDAYGTTGSADNEQVCVLVDGDWSENRAWPQGNTSNPSISYSFRVKVVTDA